MIDMESVRLVARTDCDECDGEGEKPSEDWTAFREWARRQRIPDDPEAEEQAVERYFLQVCGYTVVPAMREACDACGSSGVKDIEVPIADLIEVVLEQVDRPAIPTAELDELVGQVKKSITQAAMASQGLLDGHEMGTWLRAVQEGGEALRSLRELSIRRRDF